MRLIQSDILNMAVQQVAFAEEVKDSGLGANHPAILNLARIKGLSPRQVFAGFVNDANDFLVTGHVAKRAQTILFDADLALSLSPTLERFQDQPDIHLPFPALIYQFSRPIGENAFFRHEPNHWIKGEDQVLGVVLGQEQDHFTASAWFASTDISRVKWRQTDMDFRQFVSRLPSRDSAEATYNKMQLQLLTIACTLYVNCTNVELQRVETPPKVAAKRAKKGKAPLPEYYVCRITKTHYAAAGTPEEQAQGKKLDHMVPVRGHFRAVGGGRTVWVVPHFRGIEHGPETLRPKVYKVGRN